MVNVLGVEDYVHQGRHVYSIEEEDNRSRIRAPTTLALHDLGICITRSKVRKDARGKIFDAYTPSGIESLRTRNSRANGSKSSEKNLRRAVHQLNTLRDKIGLSDAVVEKTAYMLRKAHRRQLLHGRTVDGMLAAAVCIVCREMGTPITLMDIAVASNLRRKDISRNYRVLVLELDIKIPTVDPMKYIVKVANKLRISEKTKRNAMNIMSEVVKKEINLGKMPMGIAATVLYISCIQSEETVSQSNIAEASGVTEVTLRNRFKDLRNKLII